VTRAVVLAESGPEIGAECLGGLLGRSQRPGDAETIAVPVAGGLRGMELLIIREVIRRCRGNKAAAARSLGLHRRTLYRLLEEDAA
jgi:ActR/RegA family two-component response regulator